MKEYQKPYISDEELEFTDIVCVSQGEGGTDGNSSDFPIYEGVKNNEK